MSNALGYSVAPAIKPEELATRANPLDCLYWQAVRDEQPIAQEAFPDRAASVVERLAVRAAMARLSPDHRTILVLRLWEELSYTEIAAVLGISLPAVKMRLSRARIEFRKYYEDAE
jgi:RNA polymerase sigma factor (sigma-70 family)